MAVTAAHHPTARTWLVRGPGDLDWRCLHESGGPPTSVCHHDEAAGAGTGSILEVVPLAGERGH